MSSVILDPNQLSLAELQNSQPILTAILAKQNSSSSYTYKPRLFLLDRHLNLYLFRTSSTQTSLPLSFLPITSVHGILDATISPLPLLQLHGTGLNQQGDVIRRTWTLQCENEAVFQVWLTTVQRMCLARGPQLMRKLSRDVKRNSSLGRGSGGGAMSRSNSVSSINGGGNAYLVGEEQRMMDEFMALQKARAASVRSVV
ncbi:hypothetical protein BCR33DRAFT_723201 [Rhizoclosmatium globosum]|uniref:PH domain-containing protein n=1 Tax=Rhizoclosmatium globosum TaxID=329046 RepID=A0A1Y2BED0_9FUNG|nr:hypothetical protein BCR33DRAFT_723201 [Rhizoclosmatium globosum]|eukprot:ORY33193.1 hypothetical protein BCR33DRAFT_723201 [Rhizoclosmatium globosum]